MKPYPNEELERMSKREIIRLYKRTVEQFNDAVPVIRCKDCMWYVIDQLKSDETPDRRYKPTFCELHRTWMPSDGFCSVGKEEKR